MNKYLVFEDPIQIRNYNQDTPNSYMKKVIEGMLLIFPGWMEHGVTPNTTDNDRIVISANIDLYAKPNKIKPGHHANYRN